MIKIFVDFETTGLCSYQSEIIEGYFLREDGESFHLQSKVNFWSAEAEAIHGIKKDEMLSFKNKRPAWSELIKWLPNTFEFLFYAKSGGSQLYGAIPHKGLKHEVYFDKSLFVTHVMEYFDVYHYCKIPFKIRWTSVYDIAVEYEKLGYFHAEKKKGSKRKNFSQGLVYKALFNKSYHTHRAKSDTIALKEIYDELILREKEKYGVLI